MPACAGMTVGGGGAVRLSLLRGKEDVGARMRGHDGGVMAPCAYSLLPTAYCLLSTAYRLFSCRLSHPFRAGGAAEETRFFFEGDADDEDFVAVGVGAPFENLALLMKPGLRRAVGRVDGDAVDGATAGKAVLDQGEKAIRPLPGQGRDHDGP